LRHGSGGDTGVPKKTTKKKRLLCLCKGVHPSINDSILRNRKENEKESTICCGSSRSKKEQEESHMKAMIEMRMNIKKRGKEICCNSYWVIVG
jgi:hypothetical protein